MSWKGLGANPAGSFVLIALLPILVYAAQFGFAVAAPSLLSELSALRNQSRSARASAAIAQAEARGAGASSSAAAWLTSPATTEAPYTFEYPAAWRIETPELQEGIPFAPVNCLNQRGEEMMLVALGMRENANPIAESLDDAVDSLRAGGFALESTTEPELRALGGWDGRGRLFMANDDGMRVRAIVFIISANAQQGEPHGRVMVLLVSRDLQPTQLGPQFDRMLSSLRLK
ncbi:MAG: hypothetical protein SGJ11_00580 [Phycisphaerae bacterium]|nr:hypothetical protein [Phycisphaerae bacterium]